MKKIIAGMMALMMVTVLFCSCKDTPKTSGNTEPKETPIALGYSLNQFGLKLDNASVMQRECSYQDVAINGKCTELYGKNLGNEVKVAVLQGFYKDDLKNESILIANKAYDSDLFENEIVYQDDEIVVFNISNMIYTDTLEDRISALGLTDDSSQAFGGMLNQCANDLHTLIVKKNPVQKRLSDVKEVKKDSAIQL